MGLDFLERGACLVDVGDAELDDSSEDLEMRPLISFAAFAER